MSDDSTTLYGDTTGAASSREGSKDDPPKLRTNRFEEDHRLITDISNGQLWVPKYLKKDNITHVMTHCLLHEEISELAQALTDDEVLEENGLDNFLKILDEFKVFNNLIQGCSNSGETCESARKPKVCRAKSIWEKYSRHIEIWKTSESSLKIKLLQLQWLTRKT